MFSVNFEFDFLLFGASFSCGKHTIYENKKLKSLKLSSYLGEGD
jgi:hypothetical protein